MVITDNWRTPKWLMNIFGSWFDPCPSNPTFDGLKIEWESHTYVNPPYSNPLPWVKKAIDENEKGKTVVMLLRVDCSTKWYKLLMEQHPHIAFFNERIKFETEEGEANSPPFCSMLVILEVKNERIS